MLNLFIVYDSFINGYKDIFLDITGVCAVLSGIMVIINKNPIVSVLFLIGLFLSISIYLIMLGLNFIGLSYLLVYIGAVSILFLFILMLINVRISELLTDSNNSIPLVILVNMSIFIFISKTLPNTYKDYIIANENFIDNGNVIFNNNIYNYNIDNYLSYSIFNWLNNKINYISSIMWDGNISESSHIASIGNIMYTNYSIWLILTSIILLLAMVGAIVITIKPKNK
uniref:NADH dehydrogenase subunit 6 n=1 Tax=Gonatophragmium mori TaxID=2966219 RepID=UPI0023D85B40|nr:NADH dehydrogenase subunit 6 [Gonatophragmium mori]WCZ71154.1 NADH dehydrogenase subunit 6 [Gonatophragmium mori]